MVSQPPMAGSGCVDETQNPRGRPGRLQHRRVGRPGRGRGTAAAKKFDAGMKNTGRHVRCDGLKE